MRELVPGDRVTIISSEYKGTGRIGRQATVKYPPAHVHVCLILDAPLEDGRTEISIPKFHVWRGENEPVCTEHVPYFGRFWWW